MGKLIGFLVVLALLCGGWWALASAGLQRSIAQWFDARRAEGWQAEMGSISKQGFPLRIAAQLRDVAVADPDGGVAVALSQIDLSAPVYWPGYVTVALPDTPITVATANLRAQVQANKAVADLRLRPGTSLPLQSLSLRAGNWTIDTGIGSALGADALAVEAVQQKAGEPVYDLALDATALTPGMAARTGLGLAQDWPAAFDTVSAAMTVTFDRVWDRRALNRRRPQPRAIQLSQAQVTWGSVDIRASGDITVDEAGLASGSLSVQAENWPVMLDMAQSAGYLRPDFRPQAEQMLTALAQMSVQATALDLTITLTDGRMSMGFVPLGRAPKIMIR